MSPHLLSVCHAARAKGFAIDRCGSETCSKDGSGTGARLSSGKSRAVRSSIRVAATSPRRRVRTSPTCTPRPERMSSLAASDTALNAAPDAADSVCAGPAAVSALALVLPLLPPDAWICAAATCRSWRAAVAAVPGRWAVLDFAAAPSVSATLRSPRFALVPAPSCGSCAWTRQRATPFGPARS